MRIRFLLLAAALLAPLAAVPARAQAVPVPINNASEARQRYRAEAMREAMVLLGDWRTAWESGDARGVARQYDRNALLVLPGRPAPIQGRGAIEEALRSELPRLGSIQFRLVDSEVGDQMLYLYQEFTLKPAGATQAANTGPFAGKTTFILERDAGGGFKIRAQMFQADPPTADPPPRQQAAAASDSTN
jgi:ketosteroid isomerase-like protein